MSMRYYPIYTQGATFYVKDYDPIKVIQAVSIADEEQFSQKTQDLLCSGIYDRDAAEEICQKLSLTFDGGATDYSTLSDQLLDDLSDWITDGPGVINVGTVATNYFTDLEAEFRFDSEEIEDEFVDTCLIMTVPSPFIWNIADYDGPRTRQEVTELIRNAAKTLFKDNIDWERRLGELIGTTFG